MSDKVLPIKVAPAGKVFALAVPVQHAGHTAFSLLSLAGHFQTRPAADAKRATFPPAARVTVVLIDAPRTQEDSA